MKSELIDTIFIRDSDYNYCSPLGRSLSSIISVDDFVKIFNRLYSTRLNDSNKDALSSGLSEAFRKLDITDIKNKIPSLHEMNDAQIAVLCDILQDRHDPESISITVDMVMNGVIEAIIPLYFQTYFSHDIVDFSVFSKALISRLIETLVDEELGPWSLRAMRTICRERNDLRIIAIDAAGQYHGILRVALLSCDLSDMRMFWDELDYFAQTLPRDINHEPLHLLTALDEISWQGKEQILQRLLSSRDAKLARTVLEPFYTAFRSLEARVEVQSVIWWLDWMIDVEQSHQGDPFWFCDRLVAFLLKYGRPNPTTLFIEEFNHGRPQYRPVLCQYVLPKLNNLTTDLLSEDAMSYLLAQISTTSDSHTILGLLATENFVERHLLPLLSTDDEHVKKNVREVLKLAGQRHGMRYIPDTY